MRAHRNPQRRSVPRSGPEPVPRPESAPGLLETIDQFVADLIVRILSGGASWQLPIMRSLWRADFRYSEHRADRYAKKLGYAFELAEYLDVYERTLDGASPFGIGRTHPHTEQRIGKLLR